MAQYLFSPASYICIAQVESTHFRNALVTRDIDLSHAYSRLVRNAIDNPKNFFNRYRSWLSMFRSGVRELHLFEHHHAVPIENPSIQEFWHRGVEIAVVEQPKFPHCDRNFGACSMRVVWL
jgi:hypothetical protein